MINIQLSTKYSHQEVNRYVNLVELVIAVSSSMPIIGPYICYFTMQCLTPIP